VTAVTFADLSYPGHGPYAAVASGPEAADDLGDVTGTPGGAVPAHARAVAAMNGTILVVEDEQSIASLVRT